MGNLLKRFTNEPASSYGTFQSSDVEAGSVWTTAPSSSGDAAVEERWEKERKHVEKVENSNEELHRDAEGWLNLAEYLDQAVQFFKKKTADLSQRLSKEMSTKLSSNESSVENVSIKNRPMNVADEFQLICSNGWLEAKTELDKYADDTDSISVKVAKLTLLCDVFLTSEMVATNCFKEWNDKMTLFMTNALGYSKGHSLDHSTQPPVLSTAFSNTAGDELRILADRVDCSEAVLAVIASLEERYTESSPNLQRLWHQCKSTETIKDFVEQTVRLAWKMTIQRPPMKFNFKREWQGDKMQELYWDSEKFSEGVTICTVYPVLWHGDKAMAKGKVMFYHQDGSALNEADRLEESPDTDEETETK